MALRVELDRETLELALTHKLLQLKRQTTNTSSQKFKAWYDEEIKKVVHAINTITDIK